MKKLEADIKNGIRKKVYLLCGPQAYLRNRYRDSLINILLPEGDSINLSKYEGEGINVKEVIDLAETMPFFAERRVILLENTGFFEGAADDSFVEYMSSIPETTCFIFSEEKADARLKLYKAVEKNGTVAKFAEPTSEDIRKFILSRLSKEHRPITAGALDLLMDKCGNDFFRISGELDKLVSYTFQKDGIRAEDVEAVCSAQAEDKIFAMIDALFRHNLDEAFSYYGQLLAIQEKPQNIIGLLESQIKLIYHIRMMDSEHYSVADIYKTLGVGEYRVKKALPLARRSSKIWIRHGLEVCAEIDEATKSGRMNPRIGAETLMLELSREVK